MGGHGGSSGYSKGGGLGIQVGAGPDISLSDFLSQNAANVAQAGGGIPSSADLKQMSGGKPDIDAKAMTSKEFMDKYNAQNPNQAQKSASFEYTKSTTTSTGFSPSQNMNYKLDTGGKLTSKEQAMLDGMNSMAKPLGKDTILHRGAHKDALAQLGVTSWNGMSESQLKQALVGAQWDKKSLTSTSYDEKKSPFLSGPKSGGREVIFRIHAAGSTNATAVNPSQAEIVLGQNTHWQITDASFTGKWAHPAAGGSYKQIVIDVDVWQ